MASHTGDLQTNYLPTEKNPFELAHNEKGTNKIKKKELLPVFIRQALYDELPKPLDKASPAADYGLIHVYQYNKMPWAGGLSLPVPRLGDDKLKKACGPLGTRALYYAIIIGDDVIIPRESVVAFLLDNGIAIPQETAIMDLLQRRLSAWLPLRECTCEGRFRASGGDDQVVATLGGDVSLRPGDFVLSLKLDEDPNTDVKDLGAFEAGFKEAVLHALGVDLRSLPNLIKDIKIIHVKEDPIQVQFVITGSALLASVASAAVKCWATKAKIVKSRVPNDMSGALAGGTDAVGGADFSDAVQLLRAKYPDAVLVDGAKRCLDGVMVLNNSDDDEWSIVGRIVPDEKRPEIERTYKTHVVVHESLHTWAYRDGIMGEKSKTSKGGKVQVADPSTRSGVPNNLNKSF